MSIDLDELEKLARAATPGPWRWGDWTAPFGTLEDPHRMRRLERNLTHAGPEPYVRERADGAFEIMCCEELPPRDENRAYIAACSPDVVLALIERVRAAEAEIARIRPVYEAACAWRDAPGDCRDGAQELMDAVDAAALVSPSAPE